MSSFVRMLVVAISAGITAEARAGEGGGGDYSLPPPDYSETERKPDDEGTVVAPWERPGAGDTAVGVDDDPTPFDPSEGPQAPSPP